MAISSIINIVRVYYETFKFNLQIASAYKLEVIGFLIRQLLKLLFLLLFWLVLSKNNESTFDLRQITAYFLIGLGISEISMSSTYAFGRHIQKQIKRGEFSNNLIKPVHLLRYTYLTYLGLDSFTAIYSMLIILLGILIYPPQGVANFVLFAVFFVFTCCIGFSINLLLATVGFYSPEAGSIKNVLRHITRILSGALIPLTYFPETLQKVTALTPFPSLVYYPTIVLQDGYDGVSTVKMLAVSLAWSIALMFISVYFWKKSLKSYDGVGI